MGYSKAGKANTHARLVEAAASRFKERGVDGISLADLMKELKSMRIDAQRVDR